MGYVRMTTLSPDRLTNGTWIRRGLIKVWRPNPPVRVEPVTYWTGVLCHCGCLLRHENETCPACLVWALKVATIASWAAAERANRHLPTHHTSRKDMAA